ncbi:MAG: LptF/LptG family permease [Verrucomicrobiota bacterium]
MRIIDKYLLKEFLLPLMYCFDAFLMLFIVQDLLNNLSDFIQFHAKFLQVLNYYLIILPEAFVMMFPMALLLAALFCLSNLGKNNELIALRACGLSVLRLAAPFMGVGVVSTLAVFAVNETFVPRANERADAFMTELRGKGSREILNNFFFKNVGEHRDWYARQFNTRTKQLVSVEIHQVRPDATPWLEVFAQSATWTNNQWQFLDVSVYDYSVPGDKVVRVAATNFPSFTEPPRQLALEGRKPEQLLTRELRRHIAALEQSRRTYKLSEYQVALHYRYAFPVTCLIVIWLAIPLGMRVSKRGALLGVGVALLLVIAFYFLTHITLALGKGDHVPPALAAWLTNVIFAIIGAVLMVRAR